MKKLFYFILLVTLNAFGQNQPLLLFNKHNFNSDLFRSTSYSFSVRKTVPGYTGQCMRVRRSSDNTEQDIGFVNEQLDTVSLKTFVGSGTGYVTKWYNESAVTGYDLIQPTAVNQPTIVTSGVINRQGIYPCLTFNSTNLTYLYCSDANAPYSTAGTFAAVTYESNPSPSTSIYFGYGVNSSGNAIYLYYNQNTADIAYSQNGGFIDVSNRILKYNLAFAIKPGNHTGVGQSYAMYVNSYLSASGSAVFTQSSAGSTGFMVGREINSTFSFSGNIQELNVWLGDLSTTRTSIENNINYYYKIY